MLNTNSQISINVAVDIRASQRLNPDVLGHYSSLVFPLVPPSGQTFDF